MERDAGEERRLRGSLAHPPARLVDGRVSCADDTSADDRLLAAGAPAVHVAVLADRAISVGVGVPPTAPFLDRARAEGYSVVRRSSGGTGVLHAPGDLAWSLVLPREHRLVGRDYLRAFDRLGRGVVRFLADHGVRARWVPAPGLSEEFCLLGHRGQVLATNVGIVGGAAQHATRTALLHHGILTARIDRTTLARLFDLGGARAVDRLSSLAEAGLVTPLEELAPALAEALAREVEGV